MCSCGFLALIDCTGIGQEVLSLFFVLLAFEVLAALVGDIAPLMEETTLRDHFAAIDQSHGFSQSPTAIAHDGLQSSFQRQPPLLQSLQEFLPVGVLFTAGYFPSEHLAWALGPKAEGH